MIWLLVLGGADGAETGAATVGVFPVLPPGAGPYICAFAMMESRRLVKTVINIVTAGALESTGVAAKPRESGGLKGWDVNLDCQA